MPDKLNRSLLRIRSDVIRLSVHSDRFLVEGQAANVAGGPGQFGANLGIGRTSWPARLGISAANACACAWREANSAALLDVWVSVTDKSSPTTKPAW
jgi:hypothetical protein